MATNTVTTRPVDRPDAKSAAYVRMQKRWQLCRDVRDGDALVAKKETYLPKFEAEDEIDWETRMKLTFPEQVFDDALQSMVGMAFKTDPQLEPDVPKNIVRDWENIDGEGTHGSLFAQALLDRALQDGHCAILTEFPEEPVRRNPREQQLDGVRAYLVPISIDQIISWRVGTWGGIRLIMQVVLYMPSEEPDGQFGVKRIERYRVWTQQFGTDGQPFVMAEIWEAPQGQVLQRMGEPTRVRGPKIIPVALVYGGKQTGILESEPPFYGLAQANLEHTQVKSDRRFALHKCNTPLLVLIGVPQDDPNNPAQSEIKIGSSGLRITNPDGDAKWIMPPAEALEESRADLASLKEIMREKSLNSEAKDQQKTATEVRMKHAREESKVVRAVRSLQDALELSFQFMADYYGKPSGGSITLKRDFTTIIDADQLQALDKARDRMDISRATYLTVLAAAGVLPEDLNPEEEAEAVKREEGDPEPVEEGAEEVEADQVGAEA